eukprot:scaffold141971_cov35-Attheya_sp.AAC.1
MAGPVPWEEVPLELVPLEEAPLGPIQSEEVPLDIRPLEALPVGAGVIHLFCNLALQLETGAFFEQEWGSARWLAIYLVSSLGGHHHELRIGSRSNQCCQFRGTHGPLWVQIIGILDFRPL